MPQADKSQRRPKYPNNEVLAMLSAKRFSTACMTLRASKPIRHRSFRPELEALETRLVPSTAQPTDLEQLLLQELNAARADPAAYGQSIGVDLSGVAPSQPLALNTMLESAAEQHSADMNARNYFAHDAPADPPSQPTALDPGQRMTAAGFDWTAWGESLADGYSSTASALAALISDAGVPDLGHREDLLAMNNDYSQVGVGVLLGGTGSGVNYYTIDSATGTDANPFLTGVVYNDTEGTGKYDVGEGLGGVTLTVSQNGTTVGTVATFESGGYSIQLNPGTYTVVASGGGLAASITESVTLGSQNVEADFVASASTLTPALASATLPSSPIAAGTNLFAVGADAGGGPQVKVFNAATDQLMYSFFAYDPNFTGGVRVAVGYITSNAVPDIVTAPGPGGGPDIKVWDGATGQLIAEFDAYNPGFMGGQYVAVGDVNGDGVGDIIVGADKGGGPNVVVFDGSKLNGTELLNFMAYNPYFTGGVRVAAGDVNGNGYSDIITAPGAGGGPNITIFDGKTGQVLQSYMALDPSFTGGLYVAAGDVSGDGTADVVASADAGGGPSVAVFDGASGAVIDRFMAFDPNFTGGVRVATVTGGGGIAEVVTVAGPGGPSDVRTFNALTGEQLDDFYAFDPQFSGGQFVSAA